MLDNRLIAIAFKGGYKGGLISALIQQSPEIAVYHSRDLVIDKTGHVHDNNEFWFTNNNTNLHSFKQADSLDKEMFVASITDRVNEVLVTDKKICFRIHPNGIDKLDFITGLKVIYLYDAKDRKYYYQRLQYEKFIKPQGDSFYTDKFDDSKYAKFKNKPLNNILRRQILVDEINHQPKELSGPEVYRLNLSTFFNDLENEYLKLCDFLTITPNVEKIKQIVSEYNSKQWQRF